jgi:hypothetical protein
MTKGRSSLRRILNHAPRPRLPRPRPLALAPAASLLGTSSTCPALLLQKALPKLRQCLPAAGTSHSRARDVVTCQRGRARRAVKERRVRQSQTPHADHGGGGRGGGACGCSRAREAGLFTLIVRPAEEGGDELEDLELFGVGAVEGEEVEEVVRYDLSGRPGKDGVSNLRCWGGR